MKTLSIIALFTFFLAFISCKKDSPAPKAPIVQQVPQADGPGEYYGRMELVYTIDHALQSPLDTFVDVYCRAYKNPVNSFTIYTNTWDSVLVNNYPISYEDFNGQYSGIYPYVDHPHSQFNNAKWTYYSQSSGYTSVIDNQPIGNMSSANTLSLTISLSAPSNTLTLGNITNCNYVIVHLESDKIVMPSSNVKLVLYPEDYYYATLNPGYVIHVELVSEKDVVYNGKKYHLAKRVHHTLPISYVP